MGSMALAFKNQDFEPIIISMSDSDQVVHRLWNSIPVIDLPRKLIQKHIDLGNLLSNLVLKFEPIALFIVGHHYGCDGIIEIFSRFHIKQSLIVVDYSALCRNMTFLKGDGSTCKDQPSPDTCFNCRLLGARNRDGVLGKVGQLLPHLSAAVHNGRLGRPFGRPQFGWWQYEISRFRTASKTMAKLDAVVHATEHSRSLYAVTFGNDARHIVLRQPTSQREVTKTLANKSFLRLGFVGRFVHFKGLHILLEAITHHLAADKYQLAVHAPYKVDESDYQLRVYQQANTSCAKISWHFHDALSENDLDSIYSEIDLLIVPSIGPEYVGLVTLEALARKTSVIASDFPNQRELFATTNGVLFARPRDSKDLALKIECFRCMEHQPIEGQSFPSPEHYTSNLMRALGFQTERFSNQNLIVIN